MEPREHLLQPDPSRIVHTHAPAEGYLLDPVKDEPPEQLPDDPKAGIKLALVLVGQLYCFMFAGIIFGWSPLLDMYKSMGIFADKCREDHPWCDEQQSALANVYTHLRTGVDRELGMQKRTIRTQ